MALAIRMGLLRPTLREFDELDAGDSDAVLERLLKAEQERIEVENSRTEFAGKAVEAIVKAIGNQATAMNNLARALGKRR
jgi:hypothetical protein